MSSTITAIVIISFFLSLTYIHFVRIEVEVEVEGEEGGGEENCTLFNIP